MKNTKIIIFSLFLIIYSESIFSNVKTDFNIPTDVVQQLVNGTVSDADGLPLPGVSIVVSGKSVGTQSDYDGNFTIEAQAGDKLVFSYIGMETVTVEVSGSMDAVSVTMQESTSELDEVVLIGYGSQKKSDLTGSISSVSGGEISKFNVGNASQALMGKMAGVRIESNGGGPGASSNIVIRGVSTFTNTNPLFVIDGLFTDNMDFLNPADIESVQILKDASAAAIYGSRAANGVVIIKTKSGDGATGIFVDVETSIGTQSLIKSLDWVSGPEYAKFRNEMSDMGGQDRLPGFNELYDGTTSTIVEDYAISDAPVYNSSFRVYGGNENVKFNISANLFDQEGIIVASEYKRKSLRANLSLKNKRFKISQNFAITNTFDRPNKIWNLGNNILPTIPFYNPDNEGGYGAAIEAIHGTNGVNHVGKSQLWDRHFERNNLFEGINLEYEINDNLVAKVNTGLTYTSVKNNTFLPTFFMSPNLDGVIENAEKREYSTEAIRLLAEATLDYKTQIDKHNINALVGATMLQNTRKVKGVVATGFPNNLIREISAAENIQIAVGDKYVSSLESVFTRLNYNYDGKYFLSGTLRRDGSSRFSSDNRYGVFPSAAFGWIISKEDFLQDSQTISNLKLRLSYGELGSQEIVDYAYIPVLNLNSDGVFGTGQGRTAGVSQTVFANPNLVWETTKTTNIGLDLGLFNNRLTLTADWYDKVSEDILVQLQIPPSSGTNQPVAQNAASISNKGFELSANYRGEIKGLSFSISPNVNFLKNEVLALGTNVSPITGGAFMGITSTKTDVGTSVGSYYGYQVIGIYQNEAEITSDGAMADPNARPGDFRYADLDGDGALTSDDQTNLGSYIPDMEYGITLNLEYKNFDANLFFNGVSGVEIFNFAKTKNIFGFGANNILRDALNYWRPDNTDTNIPRLNGGAGNNRASSFMVESGDYFRLRNIQVGYTLPQESIESIGLRNCRIYVSAQNLFTITNYSGYYPEIGRGQADEERVVDNNNTLFYAGTDQSTYPTSRQFLVGLQLGF
jgi:TonB-linked SusC/RagA family outer membrane protein